MNPTVQAPSSIRFQRSVPENRRAPRPCLVIRLMATNPATNKDSSFEKQISGVLLHSYRGEVSHAPSNLFRAPGASECLERPS